jgi:GNAT superfamily N-acetyltransferase
MVPEDGIPEGMAGAVMSQSIFIRRKGAGSAQYEIDTDKARLDRAMVRRFLSRSHWAKGIPAAVLDRAIEHSLAFGLYRDGRQIGFARVVSDHATFAYLADVFVLPAERGRGLGRWLVETILAHPELQGLRRWLLGTRDAHGLYRRCGFAEPPAPFSFLERLEPEVYARPGKARPQRALAEGRAAY